MRNTRKSTSTSAAVSVSGSRSRLRDDRTKILNALMERDILALPIHDSFVVQYGLEDVLREIMGTVYKGTMNKDIEIQADLAFMDEYLPHAVDMDREGVYSVADAVDDYSERLSYAIYQKRKSDFQKVQTAAWRAVFLNEYLGDKWEFVSDLLGRPYSGILSLLSGEDSKNQNGRQRAS